jgi:hypothetical protein
VKPVNNASILTAIYDLLLLLMSSCAVAISQESFDALVAEGIEEFDLTRKEAVKDAIQQFTAQGTTAQLCDVSVKYICKVYV